MKRSLIFNCSLLLFASFAMQLTAAEHGQSSQFQKIPLILKVIEDFIYSETVSLPGQVVVNLGKADKRITLPKCPGLEPFIPTGSRLWGRTSIGVRCDNQTQWTIYVQADIKVMADVLHVARPVIRDQSLPADDITLQNASLTQMPEGIFTDPSQVIGKIPMTNLVSGQLLRPHMLRVPFVILRGQKVKLHGQGRRFSVSSEAQALADAAEGQLFRFVMNLGVLLAG